METVITTPNVLIIKHASCTNVQTFAAPEILVEEMLSVRPWVTEKFVNAQLDGREIHKLSVSNVGFISLPFTLLDIFVFE